MPPILQLQQVASASFSHTIQDLEPLTCSLHTQHTATHIRTHHSRSFHKSNVASSTSFLQPCLQDFLYHLGKAREHKTKLLKLLSSKERVMTTTQDNSRANTIWQPKKSTNFSKAHLSTHPPQKNIKSSPIPFL